MAIVIKEIHVSTTVEKERRTEAELTPELMEQIRQWMEEMIERKVRGEMREGWEGVRGRGR